MKLSEVLSALAAPFKTLPQATAALEPAKATLDSVNALFTAAGLQLEPMLSAGPDSLKLHIAGLDQSAEVTRLTSELATATTNLATARESITEHEAERVACNAVFAAIGLGDLAAKTPAKDIKLAFEAHVKKSATLDLAKTGHPPAHIPAAAEPAKAGQTGAELHAQWKAMKAGPDRLAFFTAHEAAITSFERAAS